MSTERKNSPGRQGGAGRAGPPRGDGRSDESQRKRNQESLKVGDDHKTPEMKKHRRGTFP